MNTTTITHNTARRIGKCPAADGTWFYVWQFKGGREDWNNYDANLPENWREVKGAVDFVNQTRA